MLRFIQNRCRSHSRAVERALIDGRLRLPDDLVIETDTQEFTLNWTSRFDRRNVILSGYSTIDSDSRFILATHVNFDQQADSFEIKLGAAQAGDFDVAKAYRKYAHYWLAGDELMAGRSMSRKLNKHDRVARLGAAQK